MANIDIYFIQFKIHPKELNPSTTYYHMAFQTVEILVALHHRFLGPYDMIRTQVCGTWPEC